MDKVNLDPSLSSKRVTSPQGLGSKTTDTEQVNPALKDFEESLALSRTINNRTIPNWRCIGVDPNNLKATDPSDTIEVPVAELLPKTPNCPRLSVPLYPMVDGESIAGKNQHYAHLLVRSGGTWSTRSDIRNHLVTGFIGQPKDVKEVGFPESDSMTLEQVSKNYPRTDEGGILLQALNREVPVIDVVPIIPYSPEGSYRPEFSLKLNVADLPHQEYMVYIVSQDRLVYRMRLRFDGSPETIINIGLNNDQAKKDFNWAPVPMDTMSEDLAPIIPTSHGQVKLFVVPIRNPVIQVSSESVLARNFDFGNPSMKLSLRDDRVREMAPGALSNVFLNTGSGFKKSGNLHKGDLIFARAETPIIYDIRPIAMSPKRITTLTDEELIQALGHIPSPSAN